MTRSPQTGRVSRSSGANRGKKVRYFAEKKLAVRCSLSNFRGSLAIRGKIESAATYRMLKKFYLVGSFDDAALRIVFATSC